MEIIQIWINVPALNKMDEPSYYPLDRKGTPEVFPGDPSKSIQVVAGDFEDQKGPVPTLSPLLILRIEFPALNIMPLWT